MPIGRLGWEGSPSVCVRRACVEVYAKPYDDSPWKDSSSGWTDFLQQQFIYCSTIYIARYYESVTRLLNLLQLNIRWTVYSTYYVLHKIQLTLRVELLLSSSSAPFTRLRSSNRFYLNREWQNCLLNSTMREWICFGAISFDFFGKLHNSIVAPFFKSIAIHSNAVPL